MKRIFTILLMAGILCMSQLSAQSNALFGIRNNESGALLNIITITKGESNNTYAIGVDVLNSDYFLLKMDDNSQIVWQKKIISSFLWSNSYNEITFYNDEIFFLGSEYDLSYGYVLAKVDINGNLVWSKMLTPIGLGTYHLPALSVKPNSGITVSGSTSESIDIFSLNIDGTTNWIRNFKTDSASGKNPNFDITVTDNGNIMGCAKADSDMSFYCMGSDGSIKWARRLLEMGNEYTHVKSIVEVNPNKFLICGFRLGGGFYGFIDSSGTILDLRIVDQMVEIKSGLVLNDGNILLDAQNMESHNAYMIIDDQGSLVNAYSSPFGAFSPSYAGTTETANFKYIADGSTIKKINDFNSFECLNLFSQPITFTGLDPSTSPNSGYYVVQTPGTITDYTSMQLDPSSLQMEIACGTVGVDEDHFASMNIFPTALTNNEFIIVNHNIENTSIDYQIMDLNGKVVALNTLKDNFIAITGLSAGMYVIQFTVKGNVVKSDKFVVVN